ncbi:MAG: hypothetical protein ACJ8HF_07385, partial [Pseudomonas sp.]
GYAAPFSSLYGAPIVFPLFVETNTGNNRLPENIGLHDSETSWSSTDRSFTKPLPDEWKPLFQKGNTHSTPNIVRLNARET